MRSIEIGGEAKENVAVSSNSGMPSMAYTMAHFSEQELACRHCGLTGCTDALKRALDQLRDIVDRPVIVHDAYRCAEHNAVVSLVAKSQHPAGTAADVSIPGLTLQQMYDSAKKVPAFFAGGIGVYDAEFIHVDVRSNGPARWAFVGAKEEGVTALVQA
jgi:zinc D-Ala-D-Ala carboxypeptidase